MVLLAIERVGPTSYGGTTLLIDLSADIGLAGHHTRLSRRVPCGQVDGIRLGVRPMLQSIRRRFLDVEPTVEEPLDEMSRAILAERLQGLRAEVRRPDPSRPSPDRAEPADHGAPGDRPGVDGHATAQPAMAEFLAYALDCEIHGFVAVQDVQGARWSDLLNACSEIQIHDAVLIGLDDRQRRRAGDLTVLREELVAAWASPFRGAGELRTETRAERVTFRAGPYRLAGYLHAIPTAEDIIAFARRGEMMPLTDASIEIPGSAAAGTARTVAGGDTLIVNRALTRELRLWHPDLDLPLAWTRSSTRLPVTGPTRESLVA
jgi:hypothetical protein